MRQGVARVHLEGALERIDGGIERLGAAADVGEIDPDIGIARVELGEAGDDRLGLGQPIGLPERGGFDGDGLREIRGKSESDVGFLNGVVSRLLRKNTSILKYSKRPGNLPW
jgi:hypothetical protein